MSNQEIYNNGTKFFCCSEMAVTRRRSKLWWRKAHQSKALVELQRSRRSKRDLKPSGIQFYTIVNDFHVKKCHFRKNVENQFWLVLKYVKNYAEFESAVHFAWNLQKWWVFDNFHFSHFLHFCIFFIFLGRRHEALVFKLYYCYYIYYT